MRWSGRLHAVVVLGLLALGAIAAPIAGSGAPAKWKLVASTSPKVMVVGDSISQGSAGDFTWRYRLYKHLVSAGVVPQFVGPRNDLYDNVFGQQGDHHYADPNFDQDHDSVWGRPLMDAKTTIQGEVQTYTPDYLLVLLGINDLGFGFSDPAGTEASLRTFIANARVAKADVRIVLGKLLPTQRALDDSSFAAMVADYNTRLVQVAAALTTSTSPIAVADDGKDIVPADDLYDGTHPNAHGEVRIAAGFADALSAAFALGAAYPRPYPDPPIGPQTAPQLTVTPGNGQAQLSWVLSPGATGYVVYVRWVDVQPDFTRLPYPLTKDYDPWTAGLLMAGGNYEFKLQAYKGSDGGVFSNTVAVTLGGATPGAPSNLAATAGDGTASLTWTDGANATGAYVWMRNVTAGESSFTKLPYPVSGGSWTAGLLVDGATYEFKLQSVNGLILGGFSNTVSVTPTGPAPAGVTDLTVASGAGEATLSWTAVANATGYMVFVRNVTAGEAGFTKVPYPVSGGTWTAGALENGATYEFKLQSANGLITGGFSNVVQAKPTVPPPAGPTGLTATAGNGQVRLGWTEAAGVTGYFVYLRNVTAGESDFTKLPYPVQGSSWTADLLVNGATYEFKLQSVNGLIDGGFSGVAQATPTVAPPAGPTNLSATAGDHSAKLSWTEATNATGYFVYMRNVTAGDSGFTKLPYPVDGSTWTAGLLQNGATYEFELQSVSGLVNGGFSGVVTVRPTGPAPGAPTNFTVRAGDNKAVLSWTMPDNATCVYIWVRNVTAGESGFTRLPYPVCDDAWTAQSLVDGATYEFKIQAYNDLVAGGTTSAVRVVPIGPAPPGPENLTATPGNHKASLHWDQASHATSYYIWMNDLNFGSGWTRLPYPVADDSWVAGSLVDGAGYQFKVQSVDGLQPGGFSNIVSVTPLGPTPRGPGDLSATGSWHGSATLRWTTSWTATGYFVQMRDVSAGESFHELPYPLTSGPWTATLLYPGDTYEFRLQAINGLQRGQYSNIAQVTIPRPPTPGGVTATASGPYQARLSWPGVSGADGYYIYMGRTAPGNFSPPSSMDRLPYPVTTNRFTVDYLLTPGVYWFAVTAVRYGREGGRSASGSMQPIMENPSYWTAKAAYLSGANSSGYYRGVVIGAGGGGSDSDLFVARAFISTGDWISNLFADRSGFSGAAVAPARAAIAWEPRSGRLGLLMQPTCPLGYACKPALDIQVTGTSIPVGSECGFPFPTCSHFSYNKIGASGGGGAVFVAFQLADSYASIPGAGIAIPGAIDGWLNVAQSGRSFSVTLNADQYPSWEVLRIPHYTENAIDESFLFGTRGQRTFEYLCTPCYGQTTSRF